MEATTGALGLEVLKSQENPDLISALPDSLIHHILSFLPSTNESIRTSVLSKRWHNQWTRVPILIFDFPGTSSHYSAEAISRIVDNTLSVHDCSKIKKFELNTMWNAFVYLNCGEKRCFTIRKDIEELILCFRWADEFRLPDFLFSLASLVKLQMSHCTIMPTGSVNWECLKRLYMNDCICCNAAIKSVVSGSPSLESLEINSCAGFDHLDIASKTLKRLVLVGLQYLALNVSCPKLVELSAKAGLVYRLELYNSFESVIFGSPLLEMLECTGCNFLKVIIKLKSLKKLVLGDVISDIIEVSCPNLKELNMYKLNVDSISLNLPSTICVALDFHFYEYYGEFFYGTEYYYDGYMEQRDWAQQVIEKLRNVNELKLGSSIVVILSALEIEGLPYPLFNSRSLTLNSYSYSDFPGIVCALHASPVLEKLVVNLLVLDKSTNLGKLSADMDNSAKNYWNSTDPRFNFLVSHLKNVKISGLSKSDNRYELVLDFVGFILKNASVLEKMVISLEDDRASFVIEVSKILLRFPRCSAAVVELL